MPKHLGILLGRLKEFSKKIVCRLVDFISRHFYERTQVEILWAIAEKHLLTLVCHGETIEYIHVVPRGAQTLW
jgi:hypothetical protein